MSIATHALRSLRGLALTLLLASPGCKENPVVGEISAVADKVCGCKDFKCAEAVQQEAIEYSKKHRSTMVSKEDNRAVATSMAKAKGCLDALAPKRAEPPKDTTGEVSSDKAAPAPAAPPAALVEPAPAGLEARPAEDESPSR